MIIITELFCPFTKTNCNKNCVFLDEENRNVCQLALSAKAINDFVTIFQRINESIKTKICPNNQEQSSED